jgi:CopG family nickel-responsive transcriptional regulator
LKSGVRRVSVSVEPRLIDEFDETIEDIGYNRSTAIEMAMRDFLTNYKWSVIETGNVAGAITMIYDHHISGLNKSLTDIQHDYIDVVTSVTHVHLDHENCLELIAIMGDIKRIKELTRSLRIIRGIKQLKTSVLNLR